MSNSIGPQPQLNPRASSQSGRASFSHNPFGPRRSTSVHSLHHSFQLPSLSINSTPTLKKLGAKIFHRKPSSSVSSISTGPITTATSLSPPTSERLDPTSPVARHANLPQLISRHNNPTHQSNVSSQSNKLTNHSGLKARSASLISVANRSQSLSSLSPNPNSNSKKKCGYQQPFVMDDDPDYYQNLSRSATPSLKSHYISHLSGNLIQTLSTPATPLEKPEFQTEYARQLFGGTADLRKYTPHGDEDEELAHPASGLDADSVYPHPPSRNNRASHGSVSSLGRANINTTSSTVLSQDALSEQSQSPHLASHQSQSIRLPTSSFIHPGLPVSQTPAGNPNLAGSSARSNSTFRSSVRKRVHDLKDGIKFLKPSRVSVDEANCLVSGDDASASWGHDGPNSIDSNHMTKSREALPRLSLQPKSTANDAPHQAPYTVNKPPARPLAARNSIHRHLTGSSPNPTHQFSQNHSNGPTRDHHDSKVASENDAFAAGSSKPIQKPIAHSQSHHPVSQRLRPGRIPLRSLDLDSHSSDPSPASVSTSQFRQVVAPAPTLHRSTSSSALQSVEGSSKAPTGEPQSTVGPEPTLQAGHQGPPPGPQIGLHRRRSPIIHESSNDLRRQIAREVNGMAPQRTYSDGRLPTSITPSSRQIPSATLASLNLSRNSMQQLPVSNEPIYRPSSSKAQPNPSYQQHPQQYPQSQKNSSDQESLSQPSYRHPSGHFSTSGHSNHGHPQIPFTPAGPPSLRASNYQTPNLNHRWSSSALSSTVQQRQRLKRRPQPPSQSPEEHDQSEEEGEFVCPSRAPPRSSQLLSNQRQFYVHEDERPSHNAHLRVPLNDESDCQIRKQSVDPNRMEKNLIVVNNVEYIRQCVIGRGGSSKVFRASLNDGSPKLVAIKVVGLKQSDNQTYLTFCNEIELLKRLRGNDRIINLIDSAMDDVRRKVWLVMELGETDLNQLLNRQMGKPISFRFIKHIWEQMLQAVQAVHDQDIIHTDLKPANFVLVQGSVKIIDFGIAKAIPADTTNISRETQIGTANYMSPEALIMQQFGDRQRVKMGRATDVWALGCILYQMIYGHTPFSKLDTSFKVHTIRDPQHVIDYPESVTPVEVTPEGKQAMLHQHKVIVEQEAISTMKGCLSYDKDKRPEITELLKHPFLLGPSGVSSTLPSDSSAGKITIPTSMVDDIVYKAWDWYTRKTATGNRVSENQKNKFIASIKDSIQGSQ